MDTEQGALLWHEFAVGEESWARPAAAGQARQNAAQRTARTLARRPANVPGPFGEPLTMETIPPADTRRWVVRRKAEVVAAVRGGLLSEAEACARYRLSPEELELWQNSIDRAGVPGLRVTRIQLYREYPQEQPRGESPRLRPHTVDLGQEWTV